jgi:hypothetical protein
VAEEPAAPAPDVAEEPAAPAPDVAEEPTAPAPDVAEEPTAPAPDVAEEPTPQVEERAIGEPAEPAEEQPRQRGRDEDDEELLPQ